MVDAAGIEKLVGNVAETIRRLERGEQRPTVARNASTVILARDGEHGLEIYLLRRAASMSFAAGAFVYPGGSVDERDCDLADGAWVGPPPAQWARTLSSSEAVARELVCAAVRETFEESGVLLVGPDAERVVEDLSGADWEADRLALLDRSVSMAELLTRRGLVLRADLLFAWAHWITPDVETRRFDTRFFLAALPDGQRTRHVGGEADQVAWVRPGEAVAASERGEMLLMPPTLTTLRELAGFASVANLLAVARTRDVVTVHPKLIIDDNGKVAFLTPDDPRYPGSLPG